MKTSVKKDYKETEPAVQTRSRRALKDCDLCYNKIAIQGKIDSCSHLFCYNCIKKWSKVIITIIKII